MINHNYNIIIMEKVHFVKKLVRQGTSLYVLVPKEFAKLLEVKEGDLVEVEIRKARMPEGVKVLQSLVRYWKWARPRLKEFSDEEVMRFFQCFGLEQEKSEGVEKKEKVIKGFEKELEERYGKDFVEKYKIFKEEILKLKKDEKAAREFFESYVGEMVKEMKEKFRMSEEQEAHVRKKLEEAKEKYLSKAKK